MCAVHVTNIVAVLYLIRTDKKCDNRFFCAILLWSAKNEMKNLGDSNTVQTLLSLPLSDQLAGNLPVYFCHDSISSVINVLLFK